MLERREAEQNKTMKKVLLIINCILQAIGFSCGPLITRLYFLHGGNSVWLSCFLQTASFPIMLLPLLIIYIRHHRNHSVTERTKPTAKMFSMNLPLFVAFATIGILDGLNGYLYAYGMALLPVSTSVLVMATQLGFIAIFCFILVKHKFTAYSVNAIVLLTIGVGIMSLHSREDRPSYESTKQYVMGFIMTLVGAVLGGFLFPLMELVYKKTKQATTYSLMLEIQIIVCLFATLFCAIGMIISNDYKVIRREAKHFELGEAYYYVVLVGTSILWQFYYLGSMGVTICGSSFSCGVISAMMMPVTEVLAVIFYKESFQGEKGVSLILSLWGFASYFYGEFEQAQMVGRNQVPEIEQPLI